VTDFACEIKFHTGTTKFSIDVNKNETELAKKYYLALVRVSMEQTKHGYILTNSFQALQKIILNDAAHASSMTDLVESLIHKHQIENFGFVFESMLPSTAK